MSGSNSNNNNNKKNKGFNKRNKQKEKESEIEEVEELDVKHKGKAKELVEEKAVSKDKQNDETQQIVGNKKIQSEFPVYTLSISKRGSFAFGGGGGSSKTGIPNGFSVHQWELSKSQFGNKNQKFYTEGLAVMSLVIHPIESFVVFGEGKALKVVSFPASFNGKMNVNNAKPVFGDTEITILKFNSKGDLLSVGGTAGSLTVFSFPHLISLQGFQGHSDDVTDVDFQPNGNFLASTSRDKSCKIWNTKNGKIVHSFVPEIGSFKGCRFSPDGKTLFSPSSLQKKGASTYISKWDINDGKLIQKTHIFKVHHTAFAISPDGNFLGLALGDFSLMVLDSKSLKKVMRINPHGFVITSVAFTPDNTHIISTSLDSVVIGSPVIKQLFSDSMLGTMVFFLFAAFICLIAIAYGILMMG